LAADQSGFDRNADDVGMGGQSNRRQQADVS
jgi:hypothetical protein